MARLSGFTPNTPYRAVVGPGLLIANADLTLLESTTATFDADAFINSADWYGATDAGGTLNFEPDWQNWEFAGVPGNVKGGRRMTGANISLAASITEFYGENLARALPGVDSAVWQSGATPTVHGDKLTFRTYVRDSDYLDNVCLIGERVDTKAGIIAVIKNAMNTDNFSLELSGDENRSNSDITLSASFSADDFDPATGGWRLPLTIYVSTPTNVVTP